jgi:hypothetical protein
MLELYRRENPTMQFMDGDPTGYSAVLGSFSQSTQTSFAVMQCASQRPVEGHNRKRPLIWDGGNIHNERRKRHSAQA